MFGFTKEEMEKQQFEQMARKTLANMMPQAILESPSASESQKLMIRVLNKANDINEALYEKLINKHCHPKNENVENLKTMLEYLELVELGIVQFSETAPFVAETEEDKK